MPSENTLKAASVPRAITRPFGRSRSTGRLPLHPAARARDSAADARACDRRPGRVGRLVRPDEALLIAQRRIAEHVVHETSREAPQQAVERVPHRQARQQLEQETRDQTESHPRPAPSARSRGTRQPRRPGGAGHTEGRSGGAPAGAGSGRSSSESRKNDADTCQRQHQPDQRARPFLPEVVLAHPAHIVADGIVGESALAVGRHHLTDRHLYVARGRDSRSRAACPSRRCRSADRSTA